MHSSNIMMYYVQYILTVLHYLEFFIFMISAIQKYRAKKLGDSAKLNNN